MGISQTIRSIKKEIIKINNNDFLISVNLPDNYWCFTMSQKEFKETIENDPDKEIENLNQNKLSFFQSDNNKAKKWRGRDNFLSPRTDWSIEHGDYIIEPKEVKKKIFRKGDLKNFFSGLWYIIFSLIITYLIMSFITKID